MYLQWEIEKQLKTSLTMLLFHFWNNRFDILRTVISIDVSESDLTITFIRYFNVSTSTFSPLSPDWISDRTTANSRDASATSRRRRDPISGAKSCSQHSNVKSLSCLDDRLARLAFWNRELYQRFAHNRCLLAHLNEVISCSSECFSALICVKSERCAVFFSLISVFNSSIWLFFDASSRFWSDSTRFMRSKSSCSFDDCSHCDVKSPPSWSTWAGKYFKFECFIHYSEITKITW